MKGEEERKRERRKLEKTKPLEEKQRGEHNREKSEREDPVTTELLMKDSQHEVLLPAGQVAPDSNGCALHILYFECHISVKLLCVGQKEKESALVWEPALTNFSSHFVTDIILCLNSKIPSAWSNIYFWKRRSSPWGPSSLAFFTVETQRGTKSHTGTPSVFIMRANKKSHGLNPYPVLLSRHFKGIDVIYCSVHS